MKLGPVAKFNKKNKLTPKNFDGNIISVNYSIIFIFLIYSQFGAIRKPDPGRIVFKTYFFIDSNLTKLKTELKTL